MIPTPPNTTFTLSGQDLHQVFIDAKKANEEKIAQGEAPPYQIPEPYQSMSLRELQTLEPGTALRAGGRCIIFTAL